jgi:hypothetical protein
MAKRGRKHGRKSHRRGRRGGAVSPLGYGSYPASQNSGGNWTTAVSNNATAAAASGYKTFLSNFSAGSPQQNAMALNKYAMTGPGQSGGSRRRRASKSRYSRRKHYGGAMGGLAPTVGVHHAGASAAPAAPAAPAGAPAGASAAAPAVASATSAPAHHSQKGGMFASFGSLLKEALVPLGLLAVQQTYGRKRRGSKNYTRKYRK